VAKGMGFKAAQSQIASKSGVSKQAAGAILAAGRRKASAKAVKANPNLKRIAMKGQTKKTPRSKAR
jgi:hypothetical protein